MEHDISKGVRGLIFDLDGTLVDTMPYHYQAWKNACSRYGIIVTDKFLYESTGFPSIMISNKIISHFFVSNNVTADQLLNTKTLEFSQMIHLVKPLPIVKEIVIKYYGKLPMAIGTGSHSHVAQSILKTTDLKKYFDIVITANDIKCFKPDPETFLKCSELMKTEPEYIEVFEDTDQGLLAAKTAGMIATDVRPWYKKGCL